MKKKAQILAIFGLLLVILFLISAFFIFKKNDKEDYKEASIDTHEQGADFYEFFKIEGENSLDLIDKALAEKKIDFETSLLYKMYAVFGDERLPSEFASDVLILNADEAFVEVKSAFTETSSDTQAKLSPFLKRPNDKESYYNLKNKEAAKDQNSRAFMSKIISSAYARENVENNIYCETCYLYAGGSRVKIWYPDDSIEAPEASQGYMMTVDQATLYSMAERLQIVLNNDRIFERFTELLQREPDNDGTLGGDDALDIYIGPLNARAAAVAVSDSVPFPSSAYIIMNAGWFNFDEYFRTTLTHEMFHTFQYSYTWNIDNSRWWAEATAVWSEDFIYKGFNSEQKTLKYFLPFPKKSLNDNLPKEFKYGAYVFSYYLSQNFGDRLIGNIWEDCTYDGCLDAIDDNISQGFKGQWKEFTLWNYNTDPARNYSDANGFPSLSSAKDVADQYIAGEDTISISGLKPLSAELHKLSSVVDQNVYKQLIIKDLDKFTGLSDKAAIKAVIYLKDGVKKVEDWTDLEERRFCLYCEEEDKDKCLEENLENIVLIFSNADKKESLGAAEIKTEGKEDACAGTWYGTLTVTETISVEMPMIGSVVETWDVVIKEELEQISVGEQNNMNPLSALKDPTNDIEFHVMKQEIKYNYRETSPYFTTTGAGETKREHPHPDSRGGLINDETELDTIVRFIKKKKYEGAQSVLGQGEYIFNDAEQMYGDCHFVAMSTGETKCPKYFSCGDSDFEFIGEEYIIEPLENGTRFRGSDTYIYTYMGANVITNMKWDYSRK